MKWQRASTIKRSRGADEVTRSLVNSGSKKTSLPRSIAWIWSHGPNTSSRTGGSMRKVALAHVVVKFQVAGDSYYLLHRHRKWGDWSFVGGHVESGEEGLWVRTAVRETEEELHP